MFEPFQLMPLTYNGLVVENTNRCNAKCSICYQSSGPRGSDIWGKASLPVEEISRLIREARKIPSLFPRFHLAGGEAFLELDECLSIFSSARDNGYTDISTTTNAYWARTLDNARKVCGLARANGLLRMEISWDYWHLPFISQSTISNCIIACAEADIKTNLRILTTRSHNSAEALSQFDLSTFQLIDEISVSPVFPTGRAAMTLPATDFFQTGFLGGNCHSMLYLTINATGRVYPCCAGADQTDGLSCGSIFQEPLADIARRMDRTMMLRTLVFYGPGAFIPILANKGYKLDENFTNICHICWKIFSDVKLASIVRDEFDNLERNAIEQMISSLKEIPSRRDTSTVQYNEKSND